MLCYVICDITYVYYIFRKKSIFSSVIFIRFSELFYQFMLLVLFFCGDWVVSLVFLYIFFSIVKIIPAAWIWNLLSYQFLFRRRFIAGKQKKKQQQKWSDEPHRNQTTMTTDNILLQFDNIYWFCIIYYIAYTINVKLYQRISNKMKC